MITAMASMWFRPAGHLVSLTKYQPGVLNGKHIRYLNEVFHKCAAASAPPWPSATGKTIICTCWPDTRLRVPGN
jgi:hypothetical protein